MQTFLPYPDFAKSAAVLDRQRLGKQRVETYQVLKALKGEGGLHGGWSRHPASRMWEGYELALLKYQEAVCAEWVNVRGYKDTCLEKSYALFTEKELTEFHSGVFPLPEWFGDAAFHLAHQSNLVRKAPEFYTPIFEGVTPELEYIWPGKTLTEAKQVELQLV